MKKRKDQTDVQRHMREFALDIYYAHKGDWKPCAAARVVWKLYEYHKVEGMHGSFHVFFKAVAREIERRA